MSQPPEKTNDADAAALTGDGPAPSAPVTGTNARAMRAAGDAAGTCPCGGRKVLCPFEPCDVWECPAPGHRRHDCQHIPENLEGA